MKIEVFNVYGQVAFDKTVFFLYSHQYHPTTITEH